MKCVHWAVRMGLVCVLCFAVQASAATKWIWVGEEGVANKWQDVKNWVDENGNHPSVYPQSSNGNGNEKWLPIEVTGSADKKAVVTAQNGQGQIEGWLFRLTASYADISIESNFGKFQNSESVSCSVVLRDDSTFTIKDNNSEVSHWQVAVDVGDGCTFEIVSPTEKFNGSYDFSLDLHTSGLMKLASWIKDERSVTMSFELPVGEPTMGKKLETRKLITWTGEHCLLEVAVDTVTSTVPTMQDDTLTAENVAEKSVGTYRLVKTTTAGDAPGSWAVQYVAYDPEATEAHVHTAEVAGEAAWSTLEWDTPWVANDTATLEVDGEADASFTFDTSVSATEIRFTGGTLGKRLTVSKAENVEVAPAPIYMALAGDLNLAYPLATFMTGFGALGNAEHPTQMLTLSGENTFTEAEVTGGVIDLASDFGTASAVTFNGGHASASADVTTPTLSFAQATTVDVPENITVSTPVVAGDGELTKRGKGTWALTSTATRTGGHVIISEGVVDITAQDATLFANDYRNGPTITVASGAELRLARFSYEGSLGYIADYGSRRQVAGTLTVTGASHESGNGFYLTADKATFAYEPAGGSGSLTLSGNGNQNISLTGATRIGGSGDIAMTRADGMISGEGSLEKFGTGTLTLSSTSNTYSKGTTVSEGTLVATKSGALGSGAVTVKSGATLELLGATALPLSVASLTVEAGGTLVMPQSESGIWQVITLGHPLSVQGTVKARGADGTLSAVEGGADSDGSFTSDAVAKLTWQGDEAGAGTWSTLATDTPWLKRGSASAFTNGAAVSFGDLEDVAQATVTVVGQVEAQTLSFTNATTPYCFNQGEGGVIVLGSALQTVENGALVTVQAPLKTASTITLNAGSALKLGALFGDEVTADASTATYSAALKVPANGTLTIAPGTGKKQIISDFSASTAVSSSKLIIGEGTLAANADISGHGNGIFGATHVQIDAGGVLLFDKLDISGYSITDNPIVVNAGGELRYEKRDTLRRGLILNGGAVTVSGAQGTGTDSARALDLYYSQTIEVKEDSTIAGKADGLNWNQENGDAVANPLIRLRTNNSDTATTTFKVAENKTLTCAVTFENDGANALKKEGAGKMVQNGMAQATGGTYPLTYTTDTQIAGGTYELNTEHRNGNGTYTLSNGVQLGGTGSITGDGAVILAENAALSGNLSIKNLTFSGASARLFAAEANKMVKVTGTITFPKSLELGVHFGQRTFMGTTQVMAWSLEEAPTGVTTSLSTGSLPQGFALEVRADGLYVAPTATPSRPEGDTTEYSPTATEALSVAAAKGGLTEAFTVEVKTLGVSTPLTAEQVSAVMDCFSGLATTADPETDTLVVSYDFGIEKLTVRALENVPYVILAAKVKDAAYQDTTQVEVQVLHRQAGAAQDEDITESLTFSPMEPPADAPDTLKGAGVKWFKVPYADIATRALGTFTFTVKARPGAQAN